MHQSRSIINANLGKNMFCNIKCMDYGNVNLKKLADTDIAINTFWRKDCLLLDIHLGM